MRVRALGLLLSTVVASVTVMESAAADIAVPADAVRDILRLKTFQGRDCDFCNVGSNTGLYGFDWASAGVNGANFATGPQSLAQGFVLLERFADRLAKGCTVFIPICPFSSISVPDRYGPERQYKIYPFMEGKDIYLWTPERAAAVERAVAAAEAKWTGVDTRLLETDKPVAPEAFRASVDSLLKCWRRDFEINDFEAPLSERNRKAFAANVEVFRKGLEMCRAKGWRPIVVLPPVTRYYDAVFTDKVWRQYVDDFVAAAHVEGVPYWDYSRDGRFREEANFRNSLMLNRRGSALFTKELVRRAKESSSRAGIDRVFLKELLEIPSVTADMPAVNRAVDLTRGWLEKNGMLQRMLAITDARHFAGLGVPVVIVGSMGGNAHGKDEWGDLVNMDENAEMIEKFLIEGGYTISQYRDKNRREVDFVVRCSNFSAECFETGITDAFVKKLAMRKPQFAIFWDVDFKDSAAKINAREIFKAVCGKDAPPEVRFL